MKNSTYRFIFLSFMLLMLKCAIVAATEEEDDDAMGELLVDITAGLIGAALGACSESQECASVMFPALIISLLIGTLCCCICPSDDYDDYHKRRFRFRTAGSGFAGYTVGRMIAKNW